MFTTTANGVNFSSFRKNSIFIFIRNCILRLILKLYYNRIRQLAKSCLISKSKTWNKINYFSITFFSFIYNFFFVLFFFSLQIENSSEHCHIVQGRKKEKNRFQRGKLCFCFLSLSPWLIAGKWLKWEKFTFYFKTSGNWRQSTGLDKWLRGWTCHKRTKKKKTKKKKQNPRKYSLREAEQDFFFHPVDEANVSRMHAMKTNCTLNILNFNAKWSIHTQEVEHIPTRRIDNIYLNLLKKILHILLYYK